MKADYLNPFVQSSITVLGQFDSDLTVNRLDPSTVDSPYRTLGVTSYLGLTGALAGRVIYDMERKTARSIAGAMNGEPSLEMNDLGRSALQELSNMISGNAVTRLQNNGIDQDLDITPPSLIVGEGSEISDHQSNTYVQIPLETNHGQFLINLSISESP